MSLSCGIVGLPNVGKSTIFNALSSAGADVANYPFCTIEPNVGIVPIEDPRLKEISKLIHTKKEIFNTVEFLDIAGLVKGASQGEGLGNKFLSHIRQVQAIIQVVRCFEDDDVVHVSGSIDPLRDIEIIQTELAISDVDTVDKRILRTEKQARGNDKKAKEELELLAKIKAHLDKAEMVRTMDLDEKEALIVADLFLLTSKPTLYVANVSEEGLTKDGDLFLKVQAFAKANNAEVVKICGKAEAEIASLEPSERADFLKELGIKEAGLHQLVRKSFELLDLRTFFTAGPEEIRAWTFHAGDRAPQAAGVIHSDFERGFIKADIYHFDDLMKYKSENEVKAKGLMRSEGKEYEVKDGDIIFFKFNV